VKSYWIYRLAFFACIAFSVGAVVFTLASRQQATARAEAGRARPGAVSRPREAPTGPVLPGRDGAAPLSARVRITTVVPFKREIHLHNFGDGAEDLSGWRLISPRPGSEDTYTFPVSTVLLPGESLIVIVDEGADAPGILHWRVGGDARVLDPQADTVVLVDDEGREVSRFQYTRR
jgi:hypothetical protein